MCSCLLLRLAVVSFLVVSIMPPSSVMRSAAMVLGNSKAARRVVQIPRSIWRPAALQHQEQIHNLLEGTLLSPSQYHKTLGRKHRRRNSQSGMPRQQQSTFPNNQPQNMDDNDDNWIVPLDPLNPVCNFLIEYYGLKGVKGTKRLARWSPSPNLLLHSKERYENLSDFQEASSRTSCLNGNFEDAFEGVFLEGVCEDDFATMLHLRGAMLESDGALYSPSLWLRQQQEQKQEQSSQTSTPKGHPASAFLWYRSILQQTLQAEPILHCHGLHEWAMVYWPEGESPPPSLKYQAHLPLRVSRQVINDTVERKGVSCTHVDALRFFAPSAGPLNHHGASLVREDQLRLEQPACVHAQMDLLKIVLRLQPFCDAALLVRVLELSMDARRLDVAASPYDATDFGVGVVPVDTEDGRAQYRKEQRVLMERAEPIRKELLAAYDIFLELAFEEEVSRLEKIAAPSADRFAKAEPGGKSWRRNLIASPT